MTQELANWGEFIGGIAVVISLIYVGIQIRSSVIQSKLESYTKATELWTQFTNGVVSSEEAWGVFHQGVSDYDSMNQAEKSRFGFMISMYFGIIDTVMMHEKSGVFPESETYQRALDQAYATFVLPGVQQWFGKSKGRMFAPSVEKYMVSRQQREG